MISNRKRVLAWLVSALLMLVTAALADPSTIGGKGG